MDSVSNKNALKVVLLLATVAVTVEAVKRQTGWKAKATELLAVMPIMKDVSQIDFRQVGPEFSGMDAEQRKDLVKRFDEQFKIEDQKLEQLIEKGLDAVMDVVASGAKAWDLVKEIKSSRSVAQVQIEGSSEPAQIAAADAKADVDPKTGEMKAGANNAALARAAANKKPGVNS